MNPKSNLQRLFVSLSLAVVLTPIAIADLQPASAQVYVNPKTGKPIAGPQTYFNRALEKQRKGDLKGAISEYTKGIALDPSDADAYYDRGNLRRDFGDKKGAISDYTQAIKLSPNDESSYNKRGDVLRDLGNKKGAIADWQKAAEIYQTRDLSEPRQKVLDKIKQLQDSI
jgi:tetratricopeptide (TPR) repeat protein